MSKLTDELVRKKAIQSNLNSLIKYSRRNADRAISRKKQIQRAKAKMLKVSKWVKMIKKNLDKYISGDLEMPHKLKLYIQEELSNG